jgi:hypothetical protein
MRLALLTLAVSTVALSSAYAQDATQPAAPAAPAAAAPAAPAPAAPAPAAPGAAPAAPVDPAAASAAAPAAPAPQELAPMPTDALSVAMIDTLEKVCKPVASGASKLDPVAKANGFVMKRKLWTKVVDETDTITLQPTSTANPTTCTLTVVHPKGEFQTLVNGMHAWASRQEPVMQLRAPYAYDDQITKIKRTTVGWEAPTPNSTTGMTGMAFTQLARLDGKEIVKGADQSELMYQIRK